MKNPESCVHFEDISQIRCIRYYIKYIFLTKSSVMHVALATGLTINSTILNPVFVTRTFTTKKRLLILSCINYSTLQLIELYRLL